MMATRIQSVTCHFASLPDDCLQPGPSSLAKKIQDAAGILRTPRPAEASPSRARQSSFISLQLELERRFIFSQPHNEDEAFDHNHRNGVQSLVRVRLDHCQSWTDLGESLWVG